MGTGQPPQRLRVLWIADLAPPYRVALWRELARHCDLHVRVFADNSPGRSWEFPEQVPDVDTALWRTSRLVWREYHLYFARPQVLRPDLAACDVVVLGNWDSPAFWLALVLARLRHLPVVMVSGATQDSQRFRGGPVALVRNRLLRACDVVLTYGRGATAAAEAAGVERPRIVEGFNGVDGSGLRAAALQHREASLPRPGHRFLYVGQLLERKNVTTLLHAFALVAGPGDELVICGDGPLRAPLEREAAELRAEVRFLGHVAGSGLAQVYAEAQTLVLPSTNEVWGLVVNEALACGLHAVVSERAGVAGDVAGMTGVHVAAPSAHGLSAAMRASREQWTGWIDDPAILAFDAAWFGRRAYDAVRQAATARRGEVAR